MRHDDYSRFIISLRLAARRRLTRAGRDATAGLYDFYSFLMAS